MAASFTAISLLPSPQLLFPSFLPIALSHWRSRSCEMTRNKFQMASNKLRLPRSANAGLSFPVELITELLKEGKYADRIGYAAPVYLTAVLEYLTAEILEMAGDAAIDQNKTRIEPHHIKRVIVSDKELSKVFESIVL